MYKHYAVAGGQNCSGCDKHVLVQRSDDGGRTWNVPRVIAPGPVKGGQYDSQIAVDPIDGRTIWASFLQYSKSVIAVVKSTDFGQTWSPIQVVATQPPGLDKDELAVRGNTVVVAYDDNYSTYASVTLDGGQHWQSHLVFPTTRTLSLTLSAGAAIDSRGNFYISWDSYDKAHRKAGQGPWNSNVDGINNTPERIFFSRSTNYGRSYSLPVDISDAPFVAEHCFPALAVGRSAGDVRIGWMDTRTGAWNVFFRVSQDGGIHFSNSVQISSFIPGYPYLTQAGFALPYADYFSLAVDVNNKTQVAWGEGPSYAGPGNQWVSHNINV